jgi:hypothetical protein
MRCHDIRLDGRIKKKEEEEEELKDALHEVFIRGCKLDID